MVDNLDLTIRNTDDEKIGEMVIVHDPDGSSFSDVTTVTITGQSLGRWDLVAVIYQALKYNFTNSPYVQKPVNKIEFIDCRHERGQDWPEQFFDDLGIYGAHLFVRELKFGKQQNTASPLLFRFFADALHERDVFSEKEESSSGNDERALETLDLSGNELEAVDLKRIKKLLEWAPKLISLNLKSCALDDQDVQQILEIVNESLICQMYLAGNNISKSNLELIGNALQKASERRFDDRSAKNFKAINDFALDALYEKVEWRSGKFIDIPIRNGLLDLSTITFDTNRTDEDEALFEGFLNKLTTCNPIKILAKNTNFPSYQLGDLFGFYFQKGNGLKHSDTVEEIELINFLSNESLLGGHRDVTYLVYLVTDTCPNTRILTVDQNDFSGTWDSDTYHGGAFSQIIASDKLEQISLASCKLSDDDIFCSKAKDLDNGCKPYLTFCPAGKNLLSINLSNNPLTDECVFELLKWVRDSNIISINLNGTKISLDFIQQFKEITASNAERLNNSKSDELEAVRTSANNTSESFASKETKAEIKLRSNSPEAIRARLRERSGVSLGFAN